jgi:hypothetical protein
MNPNSLFGPSRGPRRSDINHLVYPSCCFLLRAPLLVWFPYALNPSSVTRSPLTPQHSHPSLTSTEAFCSGVLTAFRFRAAISTHASGYAQRSVDP